MGLNSLLQNEMFLALIWVIVAMLTSGLAGIWLMYLMKIVMNEDTIQEKIRRQKRINEEIIRAQQH